MEPLVIRDELAAVGDMRVGVGIIGIHQGI